MSKAAPSRMGARRSRRPADLGGYNGDHGDVVGPAAPENQSTNITITARKPPLQLEHQPTKPARSGVRDRVGLRRPSKQPLIAAEEETEDSRIVVVGEKATALPRTEAGAGGDPSRRESVDSIVEKESSRQGDKDQELSRLAELVQAEMERAAEAQVVEHLKQRAAHALEEVSALRDELERTEAAVVGGKKKRDGDVAERESQLRHCQEEIRRLETEVEFYRVQLANSVAEGARLGEELKRTQESLLFLSAWDEEKIELESEVADLKAQLSAMSKEGKKRLDLAHQEFNITSATAGQKARLRLERDAKNIKLELERGLSAEFKSLRRENEVLRRETAHKDSELNRIMKNAALIESDKRAARAELVDERRMHHTTIRKKKRAEATIAELQAQLSMALSSASGRPFSPSTIGLSPRRPKKQWGSPRTPAPGRGKLLIRESDSRGGGYRELPPESSGQRSVSKVSMLLVPARKSGEGGNGRESAGNDCVAPPPTETTAAAGGGSRKPPRRGGDEERPSNEDRGPGVAEEEKDGDDIPELLPCGSGSEVTSGDVWGMLDSYVHRRSEVARANRHLGAIQAMRRHLEKNNTRKHNPSGGTCSATTVQYDDRGRRRVRVGGESHKRNSDEAVWRVSRRKRARQGERLSEAYAVQTRAPSDWKRPVQDSKKTVAAKQTKTRVRVQPHPPPRCKRDGSVSTISQGTAVRFWKECDEDGTRGKTRSPRATSPNIASTVSREEDDATATSTGRRGGRGGGAEKPGLGGGTMTMISDGRPERPRERDTGKNTSGHRRPRKKGGTLTCPSAGGGDPASSRASRCTAASAHPQHDEEEGSAVTSVVVRSPSPASSLASGVGVGVGAAAGRLWGDVESQGTLSSEQRGDGGDKGLGLEARADKKKGRKLGTWGQRKPRRDRELVDWLETNTNLVNVSPW